MGGQLQFVLCTLFHHLNIGIVSSNHTQVWKYVCIVSVSVCVELC